MGKTKPIGYKEYSKSYVFRVPSYFLNDDKCFGKF